MRTITKPETEIDLLIQDYLVEWQDKLFANENKPLNSSELPPRYLEKE